MPQRPAYLQYVLLLIVTAFSLAFTVHGSLAILQQVFRVNFIVAQPIAFGSHLNQASTLSPEASAAGLTNGSPIVSFNGRPFTSSRVYLEILRTARPGDDLHVEFLQPDGTPRHATIVLRAASSRRSYSWLHIITQDIFLRMVFPFACIALGFWVVLAKPKDLNAWLLLGIFSYFPSILYPPTYWLGPSLYFTPIWGDIINTAGPLCIMLFGIYFPQRSDWDIRYPWIKWLLIAPILLAFPFDLAFTIGDTFSFASISSIAPHITTLIRGESIIAFALISVFFFSIARKLGNTTAPDARRRLRVLYIGSAIANAPIATLLIYSLARNLDIGDGVPQWLFVSVLAIFALFPITLAYVVVVQRAMDLRILIRQGTRYAFARQSLNIVRILLAIWMASSLNDFFKHPEHHQSDVIRIFVIVGIFFAFRFILSKRLQQRIDQRFFREAYSTEQLLSELSDEARNFTEVTPLLETITRRLGETLHIERIAVFLRSGETFQLQLATGTPMLPGTQMFSLPAASTTIKNLSRAKAPANVYRDDPSSWLVDATDAERTALADLSTELLVPLPGRSRLAGVIALGPKRSEEPYTKIDRQLLQTIASQTGLALENAELLETLTSEVAQRERISREIEIAREVQERLFPQAYPHVPGVDMAGFCRPAQVVGGDYYDFFLLSADSPTKAHLALALGDISGKGISAALLMASLRASLRSIASLRQGDLAALIARVNNLVYESSTTNRYATFFYAEFDPATRLLIYVNAGHNPPYILRGALSIPLEPTGTVVGLLPDVEYTQDTIQLEPGDVLLAFTDGISEAMNYDDQEWGEDRMIASVHQLLNQPDCNPTAQQLLDCIFVAADKFTAGAPQHDDMTLLVCTVR
jgi:sigma-B regulation protein RsbU (phosphoserine phosphatase)